jgi:hypothetical protein
MKRPQPRTYAFLVIGLLVALLLLVLEQASLAQGEDQLCIPELGTDPAFLILRH